MTRDTPGTELASGLLMTLSRAHIASVLVSSLLVLDTMALGVGCGDHPDGTPLLDCDDGGCASDNGAGGGSAGGGGATTGAGTGTGGGVDDGDGGTGATGTTGIADGSGGQGNILPTDTGSTGSLPTNTE